MASMMGTGSLISIVFLLSYTSQ